MTNKIERNGTLRWVAVQDVKVNPLAQRDLSESWVAKLAADFDPDRFTPPLLSHRDGTYHVIDGQHRFAALVAMGWGDQQVQCWVYENLTEAEEADLFLWHNNVRAVSALDKFKVGVVAQRPEEVAIKQIVNRHGYHIGIGENHIAAVESLRTVYRQSPDTLDRTLSIVEGAYGEDGMRAEVLKGIGFLVARYNGALDDDVAIRKLGNVRGSLGALHTKAFGLKKQLGAPMPQCVAGAATEIINAGKGGKKLPSWWS